MLCRPDTKLLTLAGRVPMFPMPDTPLPRIEIPEEPSPNTL